MTDTIDWRRNERFHMFPGERMKAFAIAGGVVGALSGFYSGIKHASLQYLTENGHRLPRTVGGWYFYHKKKNYVMIIKGCQQGTKLAVKYALGVTAFFGTELLIDKYLRNGTIDFLNTTFAGMLWAGVHGKWTQLSRVQIVNQVKRGGFLGLSIGIAQDLMIWTRGGRIWYIDRLGIKNPRFEEKAAL